MLCRKYAVGVAAAKAMPLGQPAKSELLPLLCLPTLLQLGQTSRLLGPTSGLPGQTLRLLGQTLRLPRQTLRLQGQTLRLPGQTLRLSGLVPNTPPF